MASEELKKKSIWNPDPVYANKNIEQYKKEVLKINPQDWKNEIYNNPKIEIDMNKNIKKVESVKKPRFIVLENGVEVLKASKKELADARVQLLQEAFKPLIILVDHKEKTSMHYSKTIHQRNYRVESGDYEKDTALLPMAEVPQRES